MKKENLAVRARPLYGETPTELVKGVLTEIVVGHTSGTIVEATLQELRESGISDESLASNWIRQNKQDVMNEIRAEYREGKDAAEKREAKAAAIGELAKRFQAGELSLAEFTEATLKVKR